MRSEKELLQVLLDNIDKLEYGLCLLIIILKENSLISEQEEEILNEFISNKAPERYHSIRKYRMAYNWESGEKQPRIDWLNEQIAKL